MRRLAQNRSGLWSPSPSRMTRQRHATHNWDIMINPIAPARSSISIRRQAATTARSSSSREVRKRTAAPSRTRLIMAGKFRLRRAISPPIAGFRATSPDSKRKSGRPSVFVEHLYRFYGVIGEILADQRQLSEDIVGHGNDMTADRICLKNVEKL